MAAEARRRLRERSAAGMVTDPLRSGGEPRAPPWLALANGAMCRRRRREMAERACVNILAGLEGQRMPYCVNPEVYKK